MRRTLALIVAAGALWVVWASAANAQTVSLVTSGSPTGNTPQNHQNEPAVAMDANSPNILVAGSNDFVDEQACPEPLAVNQGTCLDRATGVGVSGDYFSFDKGHTWTQPAYIGWTTAGCDPTTPCKGTTGTIHTLPWYYENGLVSDGDPGVAIGPKPGPGGFAWSNGDRLYFSNLTSNFATTRTDQSFKGFEAIGVSRTDDIAAAAAGDKNAWCTGAAGCAPVLISPQSSTTFSDKSQIWADNASSSPFFGTVYVCWAKFQGQEKGNGTPAPLQVAVSHDGGDTWTTHQISAAANNTQRSPEDGCTIRTDSRGNAYVFGEATVSSTSKQVFELMSRSTNGGGTWSRFTPVAGPVTQPGVLDPGQGRPVMDGIAGARSDLAIAPSVDIANGAPTGSDATDRIVMSYVSGTVSAPDVFFTESTDRGATWSTPRAIESAGDRGIYTAPAISPNGTDVYVVYNAFTTPFRNDTTSPRTLVGVVLHADSSADPSTPTGTFSELGRGMPGDARGSSANALTDEFLGDYVYATATRTYGAAVWNDTRNAAVCRDIDTWRADLQNGTAGAPPAPEQACPATFGNSDIYGGSFPDPTP